MLQPLHQQLNILSTPRRNEPCDAAQSVLPLLEKYALSPRDQSILKAEGEEATLQHQNMGWLQFMAHIVQRYPGYLDEFAALEAMAPKEDLLVLYPLCLVSLDCLEDLVVVK